MIASAVWRSICRQTNFECSGAQSEKRNAGLLDAVTSLRLSFRAQGHHAA